MYKILEKERFKPTDSRFCTIQRGTYMYRFVGFIRKNRISVGTQIKQVRPKVLTQEYFRSTPRQKGWVKIKIKVYITDIELINV